MPFNLGGPELIVILVIVLIVFGAGRLPNVMRDLGTGVREFKKAQTEPEEVIVPPARPTSSAPAATTASSGASANPTHPETAETAARPVETSARA